MTSQLHSKAQRLTSSCFGQAERTFQGVQDCANGSKGLLRFFLCVFYSRMRSEGFPFIVGVWGWTCVRFVFLVSSSPRRRVVVASSSPTRRQLVNFSPLGGTFALRHTSYFQSMKSGGSLARNALFGGVKSQNGRSFSCFA